MTNHRLLVALSVILVLSSLCTLCGGRSGSVTQWNSVTEDASENLLIDIHISESKAVEFLIASDLPFVWIWSVNGEERDESEGESSNFGYMFDEYGSYNVCARGSRENETMAYACWNVTVTLVIEEENDVHDLEGLENYTLRISKRPERIISLAPSCTEILFAVGAGDRVIGVTDYCDYPPEVVRVQSIGGYNTPSLEKIVAFEPDLIVGAHGNPDDIVYRLTELGYPFYGQNPGNIEEILTQIKIIGAITGCTEDSALLAHDLRDRLDAVEAAIAPVEEVEKPRVFYNIGDFFTAGDRTFINEVIERAGGTNIAADTPGYFTMNLEVLVEKNPHVIICDSGMGSMDAAKEEIMQDPRLQIVDAVKNGCVYVIDGDIIDRPGPRIVEAVELVHGDYHDFFAATKDDGQKPEADSETVPGFEAIMVAIMVLTVLYGHKRTNLKRP